MNNQFNVERSKRGRKSSKVPKLTKSNVDRYWDEQFLPKTRKTSSKPVKCVLCSKQLKNRATYKEHLKRMHANKKRLKSCKQCGMLVLNMEQHMKSHKPHVKEIQCGQCEDKFFTKDELQDHTDTVHLKISIQCNHCDKIFTNKSAYRDHVAATTLSLMCGTCSQTFNHIESYKEHVNICAKQLHTVCDICGKQISTRNLSEHLKVHSGVKPYSCEHCGKTFAKNGTLRNHIRIHTKEKPYICSYCNKGFSQRTPLVVHMRSHTGEKPYACHLCEKRFASLSLLTIHNKNHAA